MKKLLALLCVIALLGALCVPVMAAPARIPVVAEVPETWSTVYLYAWGASETMTWPGVPMTEIDGMYVAYMNDDNPNIIINNGTDAQTEDLTVDPGLPVFVMASNMGSVSVASELPIEVPAEDKMPKPATDSVYALVPADWTTVNLYAWNADGSRNNAAWPGVPMTMGDNGLWVGELTAGFANVIINNGAAQTVDLGYGGGNAWVLLTAEAGADGKFLASVLAEDPGTYKHPNPDEVINTSANGGGNAVGLPKFENAYVAGNMNEWNCADASYQMDPNEDGSFSLTFSLTAGAYELKVTNGTWDASVGKDGGNYAFSLSADDEVTVTYDGNGVVNVTSDSLGEAPVSKDWYVAGSMNNWTNPDEAYKMTDSGDGIFTYTFAVTPGDYELKVTNGTWDESYGGDGENGNYVFNASDAGNVTVKFDSAAKTVTHEFGGNTSEPTEPTAPSKDDPAKSDKGEGTEGGNSGLIIGIIASAVILIGGGAAVFFVLKKKD